MKMTTDIAKTIHRAMAYAITICSYEATKKIPAAEDVNEMAEMLFNIYLKEELGVTGIGD